MKDSNAEGCMGVIGIMVVIAGLLLFVLGAILEIVFKVAIILSLIAMPLVVINYLLQKLERKQFYRINLGVSRLSIILGGVVCIFCVIIGNVNNEVVVSEITNNKDDALTAIWILSLIFGLLNWGVFLLYGWIHANWNFHDKMLCNGIRTSFIVILFVE